MSNSLLVSLLCLTVLLSSASCSLFSRYARIHNEKLQRDYQIDNLKEPHYFSSYLDQGDLAGARSNGLVDLSSEFDVGLTGSLPLQSFSGYFNVNKKCNSNLFTWFFKNTANPNAPVLLWLQGGPGGSSMFGLFAEIGPFKIDKDLNLQYRQIGAWTDEYHVLFVDNPVGTGFSYTDKDECYARNQTTVSNDLFNLLLQFFTVFPELRKNDFYLTGESYAGKYIPYLAYTIHERKEIAKKYFNFVGVAIGDGYTDPVNQMEYASLLYQVGLIDMNQKAQMKLMQQGIADLINKKEWLKAFEETNKLIDGDLGTRSMFTNFTGLQYYFNMVYAVEPKEQTYWQQYLKQDKVREKINVGNRTFSDGSKVETFMKEDVPKSVANEFVEVLRNYKVLLYNGQLDIIVAPVCTENFLSKLNWEGKNAYLKAPKQVWKINRNDEEPAGYVKSVVKNNTHQFHYVTVRNAGHILPFDKPREAFDLIKRFIDNKLHGYQDDD